MFILITRSYTCDLDPVPYNTSVPDKLNFYLPPNDSVQLNNSSYDPDDGIVSYYWNIYIYDSGWQWVQSNYNPNSSLTFSASYPGLYSVDLVVKDNDGVIKDGWYCHNDDPAAWHGTRDIYLIDIDYFRHPYGTGTERLYLPYGSGETFDYKLLPFVNETSDKIWEPSFLYFYVKNASGVVYLNTQIGVRDDIPLQGSFEWDGTSNSIASPYYGQHLPPGNYEVKIQAKKQGRILVEESIPLTIVGVENIEYNDPDTGYTLIDPIQDLASALYVHKGTTVTFKAVLDPPGTSWPSGKPVWGGTSGASGTGETKQVTFNTLSSNYVPGDPDYKTVTVECGNTVTIYVIVYELEGTFAPDDNFSGRSTMYYGLEEEVKLDFKTVPWSVPCNLIGGLTWSKGSPPQPGTISNIDSAYGTADYDAGASDGTAWFFLTINSGPSKGQHYGCQKDVVKPSGAYMIQKPSSGIRHTINTCSVGFLGWIYLYPKNVSFSNLSFREETCLAIGTGFYSIWNNLPHPQGSWFLFGSGNITNGCRVIGDDQVWSGEKPSPYSIGSFTWNIPWSYKADDGVDHSFTIATHNNVSDNAGKCTIQKKGAGPFSKNATDVTSNW